VNQVRVHSFIRTHGPIQAIDIRCHFVIRQLDNLGKKRTAAVPRQSSVSSVQRIGGLPHGRFISMNES